MSRFVLDTNILSALMCREPKALERAAACRPANLIVVSPVAAEITYGIERLRRNTKRRALLEREYQRLREILGWADWDERAAAAFGRIKAQLEKSGQPLEDWDVAIAAAAEALEATVVTRNQKHLGRVRGLQLETW